MDTSQPADASRSAARPDHAGPSDERDKSVPVAWSRISPEVAGYLLASFDEDVQQDVVRRALKARKRLRGGVGGRLDACLRVLQVPGFRDASKAPAGSLAMPVHEAVRLGYDELAAAVLEAWAASRESLRAAAAKALAQAPLDPPGMEPDDPSEETWDWEDWLARGEALAATLDDVGPEATRLMLALVSGRVPMAPLPPLIVSPRLAGWLEELEALPRDAVEWDDLLPFARAIVELEARWHEGRRQAAREARDAALSHAMREYADELLYLGLDLDPWRAEDGPFPSVTRELAERLAEALKQYRPIRAQGATRAEEAERAEGRRDLEATILRIFGEWETLPRPEVHAGSDEDDDDAASGSDAEASAEDAARRRSVELVEERRAHRAVAAELDGLRGENAALAAEVERLRGASASLRLAKQQLDDEIGELRTGLDRARTAEEHWRQAYVQGRRSHADGDNAPLRVASVADALALAERAFPDALTVALNGKSDPRVPFAKPEEVFDALAWLATCYRRRSATALGEACPGWFHKPDQSDATVGMYPEWYRMSIDGRTVPIRNHLGKGNSFDPRSTIRIGFAWDEQQERVLVGYVGRHQRNRQS